MPEETPIEPHPILFPPNPSQPEVEAGPICQNRFKTALHVGKRAVQGAVVAMEIGPFNEIIRYSALGAALVASNGDPLIGAAVMGGTTFAVEGSAALAVSGMLASESGKKTINWAEKRLSKTIRISPQKLESWKMKPLSEAGIGLVVGSVAVLAEKQREDKERTAQQNRKYGLFTAGWLSIVCAGQGALVAVSKEAGTDYSAYLNARTIGAAALAIGAVIGASRWVMRRERRSLEKDEII